MMSSKRSELFECLLALCGQRLGLAVCGKDLGLGLAVCCGDLLWLVVCGEFLVLAVVGLGQVLGLVVGRVYIVSINRVYFDIYQFTSSTYN